MDFLEHVNLSGGLPSYVMRTVPMFDPDLEVVKMMLCCRRHDFLRCPDLYSWWPLLHQIGLVLRRLQHDLMWPLLYCPWDLTLLVADSRELDFATKFPILCSIVDVEIGVRLAGCNIGYWTSVGHSKVYASSMSALSNID